MSVDASLSNNSPSSAHISGQPSSLDNRRPSGPMPYLTQQYALPIHHNPRWQSGDHRLSYGDTAPRAENTLRRKTPNGTLHAGYDGSGDEPIQPYKHQLLPFREGNPPRVHHSEKRTFAQHQQQQQQNAGVRSWHASPVGQFCGGMIQAKSNLENGWPQPGQFQQPQNSPTCPMMDSMLHQMPMHHHGMQQYYGQTVPSVIQPSFQHLGPTASGLQDSGPYGPYWHDGTFVPYRPAAIRDPRFYHHQQQQQSTPINYSGSLPSSQHAPRSELWQHHPQRSTQPHWALTLSPSPFALPPPLPTSGARPPASANYYTDIGISPHYDRHYTALQTPLQYHAPGPISRGSHEGSNILTNDWQREEIFGWALQRYRDLLSHINVNHQRQQHSRHVAGRQQLPLRPNFFPKPPRPSASGSTTPTTEMRIRNENLYASVDEDPPLRAQRRPSASEDDSSTPRARSPATYHSEYTGKQANGAALRSSHDSSDGTIYEHKNATPSSIYAARDRSHTLRHSAGSAVMAIESSPVLVDNSPPAQAVLALDYIASTCRAADWQWTDGIQLGGCLAYALGNYKRAMQWFRRVLENDPRHLEASSNLAATLLALGRRSEAEQNWQHVIRAAPNHFEAVEHLVGLLCTEQRGKDAIKVIEYVERSLRLRQSSASEDISRPTDRQSERSSSTISRSPAPSEQSDPMSYEFDVEDDAFTLDGQSTAEPGFGSSGFAIPGSDNGRILSLIHAKGNMLYGLGDNAGAAKAFEDAVLIATGRKFHDIQGLVTHILAVVSTNVQHRRAYGAVRPPAHEPVLLSPDQALATAKLCFPNATELPGLQFVPRGFARKAIISTTSNSLLSLAKIFQDGMSNAGRSVGVTPLTHGVRDILALYYLSLSLQPSPSTANNVGILLASVQQATPAVAVPTHHRPEVPGVIPGSGVALALQYYNYGLQLDRHHAHLYTNLGSLLKDIGQLDAAIQMYEHAVQCDGKFDIALANLANAVKDKGRISDAINYYKRAVEVNPEFAEAVCGLANALNSVCGWQARGGIAEDGGKRDRWHVDGKGMLLDARQSGASSSGWLKRVLDIVEKQLADGEHWGTGTLNATLIDIIVQQLGLLGDAPQDGRDKAARVRKTLMSWAGKKWEGARLTRLIERGTRRLVWQYYQDLYVTKTRRDPASYNRPQLPAALFVPTAPTVLPFHTFTCPMSAKQIRLISQRNGLRISVSTLRAPWLPKQVFMPPSPPAPCLRVGYVSSDFNNHPLAHLMQSVFGLHDTERVEAYCYATTASDNSVHRRQIENEAPVFHDASTWSAERLVKQIAGDQIHILVNLNGYTRGARNEVFAARPAPIQMSFMGFAGTMGAEWCDYLLADDTAVPVNTLRPWRRNVDLEDKLEDENSVSEDDDWVYGENIIYSRDTFFCCDHKQSAPDAHDRKLSWRDEQTRRWKMRKELFPQLSDDTIIFGNFNQLYKIEPTTFRTWLRILARVPNSILWLLRFPDLGESHLLATARLWAGREVASRVIFTDVAPKHLHISRARVCDLVLDTAECNAHTTAADVLWSGTPLLTLPRYQYKMCSRMAASILKGALPKNEEGRRAETELIAKHEEDYEEKAVALGTGFAYVPGSNGEGTGRMMELRKLLFHARWKSALFDTKRWVSDLEDAYDEVWRRWVAGEGGDIWLDQVARGRQT